MIQFTELAGFPRRPALLEQRSALPRLAALHELKVTQLVVGSRLAFEKWV